MTDLRKMAVFRDVQVAMDFQKMAENGYIDEEFTMYGCVYLKANQRYYLISSEEIKIVEFLQSSIKDDLYPSPIERLTKVCPVPLGEREEIANTVKVALAQKLQQDYSLEWLQELQRMLQKPHANTAKQIVQTYVQTVVNSFSHEKIELAEKLVLLAYAYRVLTRESYDSFMQILQREYDKLRDDILVKDLLHKTLHTIMYTDHTDKVGFMTNARLETLEKKRRQLLLDGCIVSPIYTKKYWYNNQKRLQDIQATHKEHYLQALTKDYFACVREIFVLAQNQRTMLPEKQTEIRQKYGEKAVAMLHYYCG